MWSWYDAEYRQQISVNGTGRLVLAINTWCVIFEVKGSFGIIKMDFGLKRVIWSVILFTC
jgi:hypothetical protein